MKLTPCLPAICLACALLPQTGHAVEIREISTSRRYITESEMTHYNDWSFNLQGAFGARSLRGDQFAPVNRQDDIGVLFDFGREHWPAHICIDYFTASAENTYEGTAYKSSTDELDIGLRYVVDMEEHPVTFTGGAGLAMVSSEVSADTGILKTNDSDTVYGIWAELGAYYRFKQRFLLGGDIRYSETRIKLNGANQLNAGGWQTNFTFGIRF